MNLITIYDADGREIDMTTLGLKGLRLRIPSPSYQTVTKDIDGRGRPLVVDRLLSSRKLLATFLSEASSYPEALSLRNLLYEMLGNGKIFYISEVEVPMRRWKVYLDEWTPDRIDAKRHLFEVPLLAESGTSESISIIKKKFTTPTFSFKNDGNQTIDPRYHSETEIELVGASTNPTIRNLRTGEEWSWTGSSVTGDKLLLKGVRSLKNGVSIFGQTNKKLITIKPGWNNFEILGVVEGQFELNIRTRFYFL